MIGWLPDAAGFTAVADYTQAHMQPSVYAQPHPEQLWLPCRPTLYIHLLGKWAVKPGTRTQYALFPSCTLGASGCESLAASAASSWAADAASQGHAPPLPWLCSRPAASQLLASALSACADADVHAGKRWTPPSGSAASIHDCEGLLRFANSNGGTERLQGRVCQTARERKGSPPGDAAACQSRCAGSLRLRPRVWAERRAAPLPLPPHAAAGAQIVCC